MCDSHRYIYSKCIGKLRVCMCVRQSQVYIQQMYRESEGVHVCAELPPLVLWAALLPLSCTSYRGSTSPSYRGTA